MTTVTSFLSLALFMAFIVGFVKPSLVQMANRQHASIVYLGGCLALYFLGAGGYPVVHFMKMIGKYQFEIEEPITPKGFKYSNKLLKEYRKEPQDIRHDIVNSYVSLKDIPSSITDEFYACVSEYSFTKNGERELGDVLGWCYIDYKRDPEKFNEKINFDTFLGNFSGWDGSYIPLVKMIKENTDNDRVYQHISTDYELFFDRYPHALIKTAFLGTNTFGQVMKQTITARVDVKTGKVIEILPN